MKTRNVVGALGVGLALAGLPSAAWTQEVGPQALGQRVRVTAAGPLTGVMMGTLVDVGPDHLTLLGEHSVVSKLPISSVTRVEVSHPRRKTRQGLLIGAAAGLLGAAVVMAAPADEVTCGTPQAPRPCTDGEKVVLGALTVGAWSGIGAWVGHSRKSDQWTDVPLDRLTLGVRPERGGARVALAFSF